MKTHVLIVSQTFPKTVYNELHSTGFVSKIMYGQKIHTIRENYEYWAKRIKEVEQGQAELIIRTWSGVPYRSVQNEHIRFNASDGVGVTKVYFDENRELIIPNCNAHYTLEDVAKNDGLTIDEFHKWFAKTPVGKPLAMIHFNDFRYNKF
jgi:hypothetical protein